MDGFLENNVMIIENHKLLLFRVNIGNIFFPSLFEKMYLNMTYVGNLGSTEREHKHLFTNIYIHQLRQSLAFVHCEYLFLSR
jgi:hypothetical protein